MIPDMGIWRGIELIGVQSALIGGVYVKQDHNKVSESIVKLDIEIETEYAVSDSLKIRAKLTAPNGSIIETENEIVNKTILSLNIPNAELWYPRGYGEQPLYELAMALIDKNGETVDSRKLKIGLRTVSVSRDKLAKANGTDNGEEFAFVVNGIKILAQPPK